MVQKTFGIYDDANTGNELFIEAGTNHVACWTKQENTVTAFEFFHDKDAYVQFETFFNEVVLYSKLLEGNYDQVKLIIDHNACLITDVNLQPSAFKEAIFNRTFLSDKKYAVADTVVNGKHISYCMDHAVSEIIDRKFSGSTYTHKYALLLAAGNGEKQLSVIFYPQHITLYLQVNAQQFFINSFTYSNGEDVLYHILHALHNFDLEPGDIHIQLMGMIDADSKIYKELYAYFPHLDCISTDEHLQLSEAFKTYSSHYFSPFFNLPL